MLNDTSIATHQRPIAPEDFSLSLSVDRTSLSPCITFSSSAASPGSVEKVPFDYATPEFLQDDAMLTRITSFLGLPSSSNKSLGELIKQLWNIFQTKEAFVLETRVSLSPEGVAEIHDARFGFDDAAFRSSGRQQEVHQLRDLTEEVPEELEAEKHGIIYVK